MRRAAAALAVLLAVAMVVPAAPASAYSTPGQTYHRKYVVHCGITSCSAYFTRRTTHHLQRDIDFYGGLSATSTGLLCAGVGAASGPGAPIVITGCGAYMATSGLYAKEAIKRADRNDGCLKVTVRLWPATNSGPQFSPVRKTNRYCRKG